MPAPADTVAPRLLYTDLVAGPTSGGENNAGVYLSLFGVNLGSDPARARVFLGDHEVAVYRYFGPSVGRADVQQITVQPGNVGKGSLPIRVEVDGVSSNTNLSFLPNEGNILFVDNVNGNDMLATANRMDRPWRHLQTGSHGGALAAAGPGDVLVLRGHGIWHDIGADNRWVRLRYTTGTRPTGRRGSGYIALIAYPGETVRYQPPPGTSGGIHGVGDGLAEFADWIVISGLHIEGHAESRTDGSPVNLQVSSDHWRVVNNELGPWPAPPEAHDKAGGLTGNGVDVRILGNHIHDIGGGTENHGIYLDTASADVEIAYNHIHHVGQGNLIQTFDNLGGGNLTGLSIHHNLLHDGGRYGVNVADGTQVLHLWSNFIHDTALAGIRLNVHSDGATDLLVERNTLFNVCTRSRAEFGAIENTWTASQGSILVTHNVVAAHGKACSAGYDNDGSDEAVKLVSNQYSGYAVPTKDVAPIRGEPRFADADARDLRLQQNAAPAQADVGASRF
jgi:hypothetical protein